MQTDRQEHEDRREVASCAEYPQYGGPSRLTDDEIAFLNDLIVKLAMLYAANRKHKPSKAELLRVLDHIHRGSFECILR